MSTDPKSSSDEDAELDTLFSRLRAEGTPAAAESVALGLPTRVRARLAAADAPAAYGLWFRVLGPLALSCALYAGWDVGRLRESALGDPLLASWIFTFFGQGVSG